VGTGHKVFSQENGLKLSEIEGIFPEIDYAGLLMMQRFIEVSPECILSAPLSHH